jgi:glycerophosphoryl diester phosphodiesterase
MAPSYLDSPLPRILAHRGLALGVPENTAASFRAALDAGADYLETDAHVTADGVAVLAHDPSVLDGSRRVVIADETADRIEEVDLGGGERVPRLDDVLTTLPHARFNIDVKARAAAESVARAVLDARATDRVLVTSFDGDTRRAVVRLLPGVATSASGDLVARVLLPAHLGMSGAVRRLLRGIPCVQVPERRGPVPLVTRRTVRTFHAAGVEVHVWTVNDPAEMRRLVALGVDGIVTDRCDLAAAHLRARPSS